MVVHTFNSNIREAEAGGSLNSKLAWALGWVPGQLGLHRETLVSEKAVGVGAGERRVH